MNVDLPVTSSRTRALEHVTSLSFGAPLDAGACVTLNFHPDRAVAGRPILERLREDGLYVPQFVPPGSSAARCGPGGTTHRT
ncbi:hypothetical protein [Streptomyces sp. NPDC055107]